MAGVKAARAVEVMHERRPAYPTCDAPPLQGPLGGYIFVCNNETMEDDMKRDVFGLPQKHQDSVKMIQPGMPLFLYNYSTHELHGVFEASSDGGLNIDTSFSKFPSQVKFRTRESRPALKESQFRKFLFHYDGPKFRLELSEGEADNLIRLFHGVGAPTESSEKAVSREDGDEWETVKPKGRGGRGSAGGASQGFYRGKKNGGGQPWRSHAATNGQFSAGSAASAGSSSGSGVSNSTTSNSSPSGASSTTSSSSSSSSSCVTSSSMPPPPPPLPSKSAALPPVVHKGRDASLAKWRQEADTWSKSSGGSGLVSPDLSTTGTSSEEQNSAAGDPDVECNGNHDDGANGTGSESSSHCSGTEQDVGADVAPAGSKATSKAGGARASGQAAAWAVRSANVSFAAVLRGEKAAAGSPEVKGGAGPSGLPSAPKADNPPMPQQQSDEGPGGVSGTVSESGAPVSAQAKQPQEEGKADTSGEAAAGTAGAAENSVSPDKAEKQAGGDDEDGWIKVSAGGKERGGGKVAAPAGTNGNGSKAREGNGKAGKRNGAEERPGAWAKRGSNGGAGATASGTAGPTAAGKEGRDAAGAGAGDHTRAVTHSSPPSGPSAAAAAKPADVTAESDATAKPAAADVRVRRPAWQGNDAAILRRLAEAESPAPTSSAAGPLGQAGGRHSLSSSGAASGAGATPGGPAVPAGDGLKGLASDAASAAASSLGPAASGPRATGASALVPGALRAPWQQQPPSQAPLAAAAAPAAAGAAAGWAAKPAGQSLPQPPQEKGSSSGVILDRPAAQSRPLILHHHHQQQLPQQAGPLGPTPGQSQLPLQQQGYSQPHRRFPNQRMAGAGGNRSYRGPGNRQPGADAAALPHAATVPASLAAPGLHGGAPFMGAAAGGAAHAAGPAGAAAASALPFVPLHGGPQGVPFAAGAVPFAAGPGMRGMAVPVPIAGYPAFPPPPLVLLHNAGQLHEEVCAYAEEGRAGREARLRVAAAVARLRGAVRDLWAAADVEVFGSHATGLALPHSDVDVAVINAPPPVLDTPELRALSGARISAPLLRQLAAALQAQPWCEGLTAIETARIPVIKLRCRVPLGEGEEDLKRGKQAERVEGEGGEEKSQSKEAEGEGKESEKGAGGEEGAAEPQPPPAYAVVKMDVSIALSRPKDFELADAASREMAARLDAAAAAHNGAAARQFVLERLRAMPALAPLVLLMKAYLHSRGLKDVYTGGLGSYSLTMMLVFYLERAPVSCGDPSALPSAPLLSAVSAPPDFEAQQGAPQPPAPQPGAASDPAAAAPPSRPLEKADSVPVQKRDSTEVSSDTTEGQQGRGAPEGAPVEGEAATAATAAAGAAPAVGSAEASSGEAGGPAGEGAGSSSAAQAAPLPPAAASGALEGAAAAAEEEEGGAPAHAAVPAPNLGVLLLGFLQLFGQEVDLGRVRLVLRSSSSPGGVFLRDLSMGPAALWIDDPLRPGMNIGAGSFAMWRVQTAFREMLVTLSRPSASLDPLTPSALAHLAASRSAAPSPSPTLLDPSSAAASSSAPSSPKPSKSTPKSSASAVSLSSTAAEGEPLASAARAAAGAASEQQGSAAGASAGAGQPAAGYSPSADGAKAKEGPGSATAAAASPVSRTPLPLLDAAFAGRLVPLSQTPPHVAGLAGVQAGTATGGAGARGGFRVVSAGQSGAGAGGSAEGRVAVSIEGGSKEGVAMQQPVSVDS